MPKTRQAANRISESPLLNFLVNRLTDPFNVELAANAELGPEDLFEVLVGACANGASVSSLCERSEELPHANTVSYHLRERFDLEAVEFVANTLLQTDIVETLNLAGAPLHGLLDCFVVNVFR